MKLSEIKELYLNLNEKLNHAEEAFEEGERTWDDMYNIYYDAWYSLTNMLQEYFNGRTDE